MTDDEILALIESTDAGVGERSHISEVARILRGGGGGGGGTDLTAWLGEPIESGYLGIPTFQRPGAVHWYDAAWWAVKPGTDASPNYSGAYYGFGDATHTPDAWSIAHIAADDDLAPDVFVMAGDTTHKFWTRILAGYDEGSWRAQLLLVDESSTTFKSVEGLATTTATTLALRGRVAQSAGLLQLFHDVGAGPVLTGELTAGGVLEVKDSAGVRAGRYDKYQGTYDSVSRKGTEVNAINDVLLEPASGYVFMQTLSTAPSDQLLKDIESGELEGNRALIAFYPDEAGNALKVKVLYSNGATVKVGSIALT